MAYMMNQPLLLVILEAYTEPTFPFVFTIQKINRPQTAGRTMIDLNQKKALSW